MTSTSAKIKTVVLGLLFALHALYAVAANPAGYFSIDEGAYSMMARSFAESGSLSVSNGYQEFPSRELAYMMLREDTREAGKPRLVPQYPSVYAFVAYPFYAAAGFRGLQYMNLLAFLATVLVTVALARRVFGDANLALNAALFLVLAGFTWEYAHGAWPHALSMLAVATAVWLAVMAWQSPNAGEWLRPALAAGLAAGIGAGFRYDVILVIPAMAIPFLFASPARPWPPLAMLAGALPGLALLAATNYAKFGIASPFTYGFDEAMGPASAVSYAPLILAAVTVLAGLWAATRPGAREALRQRPWMVIAVLAAMVALVMLIQPLRAMAFRLANGVWQLAVDIRVRDANIVEAGVERTSSGAVVYGLTLKKALLQSCPWLVAIGLPLAGLVRGHKNSAETSMMLLLIAGFTSFYGFFAWHGGFSFNMRYFLPVLPAAAILAAICWRALAASLAPAGRYTAIGVGMAMLLVWVQLIPRGTGVESQEPAVLSLPLALAATLAVLLVLRAAPWPRMRPWITGGALAVFAMSLTWAAAVGLAYDLLRSYKTRAYTQAVSREIASAVPADSLLLAGNAALYPNVMESGRIRLALPATDDFKDFRPLVDAHLAAGRPVFGVFAEETWARLEADGTLSGLRVVAVQTLEPDRLARIIQPEASFNSD